MWRGALACWLARRGNPFQPYLCCLSDENCGEWKRLQFLWRLQESHVQSLASQELCKRYSKKVVSKFSGGRNIKFGWVWLIYWLFFVTLADFIGLSGMCLDRDWSLITFLISCSLFSIIDQRHRKGKEKKQLACFLTDRCVQCLQVSKKKQKHVCLQYGCCC